jgi:HK97 family phage major capsid protein
MYGGFTVYHQGELQTAIERNVYLRKVTLKPRKIMGYTTVSNELLRDWSAATSFLQTQMRMCILGTEDYDFLRGDGVNKALGIISAPATIGVNRQTASQISFTDITNMYARFRGANGVWIAAPSTIPQLVNIRDAGSNNLWITAFQSVAPGLPGSIYGMPIIFSERLPALGSKGDLMLVDASKYLVCDGTGMGIATSEHFLFSSDSTVFRVTWFVDGQPWLSEIVAASNRFSAAWKL